MRRAAWRTLALALLVGLLAAPAAQAAKPPKRIVALTPFSANVLVKLGVRPVAVGVTPGNAKLDRRLRKVRRLPLSHASNGPNLEELAALDPDLVISDRPWRAGHGAIRRLGIKVVIRDPKKVSQVPRAVKRIGALVQRAKRARKLARRLGKQIRRARRGIRSRPRVLVVLGVGETPYAFLNSSWGGDLVAAAGGRLLTSGLKQEGENKQLLVSGGFAHLSDEWIFDQNPDVVIGIPHGRAESREQSARALREHEYLKLTNAGANGRIYVSAHNTLLQPGTDVAKAIRMVRKRYLRN